MLERQGKNDEALEALSAHLDNPDAAIAVEKDSAPAERLSVVLHAAVLEVALDNAAVNRRVDKRLLKQSGVGGMSGAKGESNESRRSALAFELRAKALAKDDEEVGPVARRLENAVSALETAAGAGPIVAAAEAAGTAEAAGSQDTQASTFSVGRRLSSLVRSCPDSPGLLYYSP